MTTETPSSLATAWSYYWHKHYNDALSCCDQILAGAPENPEVLCLKACCHAALKHYQAAETLLKEVFAKHPGLAIAFATRGHLEYGQKNVDSALRDLNEAIRLDPNLAIAYQNRGKVHNKKGDLEAALRDYSEAICLDPNDASAYNNRGTVHDKKGDLEAALWDYSEAIRLDPNYASAYNNRGCVYEKKDNLEAAIRDYSEAIRLDPKHEYALRNLDRCFTSTGNLTGVLAVQARLFEDTLPAYKNSDANIQFWNDSIVRHVERQIRPGLKNSQDRFVMYWHILMRWGVSTRQSIISNGSSSYIHEGTTGAGYLLLSERNIWIVNLGEVSKKFVKSRGVLTKAFLLFLSNIDFTKTEKEDRIFTIPHTDIHSATLADGVVHLNAGNQAWEINPFFKDDEPFVYTALNLARKQQVGQLFEPLAAPAPVKAAAQAGEDIYQSIEKLKKLLDIGAITQAEYDEKKRELLKRI